MNRVDIVLAWIFCFFLHCNIFGQGISVIEPPYWWAGMANDTLQIFLHDDEIGDFSVIIEDENVDLISVEKPPNSNYLILYISTIDAQPCTFDIRLESNQSTRKIINYELKKRHQNSAKREGFSSKDVLYLIMPDRFSNGDPSNDNHNDMLEKVNRKDIGGRHGGDIKGITDHLDYLQDLGITTIWNTPLLEDNVPSYSYHGYAISDYYKVDPRYGTNQDYKNLSAELQKRDMKLIMDVVTNHCSSVHWWMDDLPYEDWVHQFPEFQRSNYRMTTQFDPYKSKLDFKLCEKGWFDNTMPDLNQSNPHLIRYLAQNTIWWMEFANLDGLRVDTYSYNDKQGIAYWTKRIMDEYPLTNIVGEIWMHSQAEIAYWQTGNTVSGSYDTHLPSVMDFTLHDVLAKSLNEDHDSWSDGIINIYNNFTNDFLYPNPSNIIVFGENHDTDRLLHTIEEDVDKYKLAIVLLATTRGIPLLYYGTEVGVTGEKRKGDGDLRKDFPGGWKGDKINLFEEKNRVGECKEIFDFTKSVLNLRKEKNVFHTGKLLHFVPQDNVYVYFRYTEKDLAMVILNNSAKDVKVDFNNYVEVIGKEDSFIDAITKEMINKENCLISAKSSLILERKNIPTSSK